MGEIQKGQRYFCKNTQISIYVHYVDSLCILVSFNCIEGQKHTKKVAGYLQYITMLGFELIDKQHLHIWER